MALRRARLAQLAFWSVAGIAVMALALAVYMSRQPHVTQVGAGVSQETPEMPQQQVAQENLVGGLDSANLPFKIKTLKGYQDKADTELYHLQDVSGTFRRDNGKDLEVSGDTGDYHAGNKVLRLDGKVMVSEAPRFSASMASAVFDLNQHRLSSNVPVHVTLDNGTIQADTMVAENNGERMLFKGNVRAHFDSQRPAPPKGETPQ
jgi:LPS export ABC transporter protein LptC